MAVAADADREEIFRLRHAVYAEELGQHPPAAAGRLTDALDDTNLYITARRNGLLRGFVSVTPPGGSYSLDKYLPRRDWPLPATAALYEVRLLTVRGADRGGRLAALLMYAALRWVESQGGTQIMALGRRALKPLYARVGLSFSGLPLRAGAVDYELMSAPTAQIRAALAALSPLLTRLHRDVRWELPCAFDAPCTHGGAFWEAVGDTFQALERREDVVSADVLDAWFPPAPGVLAALQGHLPWLLQTSPPAGGAGLTRTIAAVRGVPPDSLCLGAGSSALIYLALPRWLSSRSRVLLPDPIYGEYAHILEQVIGCRIERLATDRADGFRLSPDRLRQACRKYRPSLVILVNPNNPTGDFLPQAPLQDALADLPPETRVWVDEAYIDYLGPGHSLEAFAAQSRSVVVCKSLSKGYALSGVRAAYLCGPPPLMRDLRRFSPPWNVSLPAQVAAVAALRDPDYYARRYAETAALRDALAARLRARFPDWDVRPGPAHWLLCHLPPSGPDAAAVAARCRTQNVFVREAASISPRLGPHALRVAVKDAAANARIEAALAAALARP